LLLQNLGENTLEILRDVEDRHALEYVTFRDHFGEATDTKRIKVRLAIRIEDHVE